jgi:hypothetical protein
VLVACGVASSACSTSHPAPLTASVALPAAVAAAPSAPSSAPASSAPAVDTSDEQLRRAHAAAALTGTLLVSATIGDEAYLRLYEIALGGGGAPVVITKPDVATFSGDSAPSFSPDGTKITWTRTWSISANGLWIAGADGAGARLVANCKQFWMCNSAQLAADGNVYYAGGALTPGGPLTNIEVVPQGARASDGRNRHWAGDDQTCAFGAFRLSPDGTKIVVVAGGKSSPKCTKRGIRTASATVKGVLGDPLPLSVDTTDVFKSYAEFSKATTSSSSRGRSRSTKV